MNKDKFNKNTPQNDGFPPVASSNDFTGLIPAGIDSSQELEYYNEMYAFIPLANINTKNQKDTTR